jgi:hypothetical protein
MTGSAPSTRSWSALPGEWTVPVTSWRWATRCGTSRAADCAAGSRDEDSHPAFFVAVCLAFMQRHEVADRYFSWDSRQPKITHQASVSMLTIRSASPPSRVDAAGEPGLNSQNMIAIRTIVAAAAASE